MPAALVREYIGVVLVEELRSEPQPMAWQTFVTSFYQWLSALGAESDTCDKRILWNMLHPIRFRNPVDPIHPRGWTNLTTPLPEWLTHEANYTYYVEPNTDRVRRGGALGQPQSSPSLPDDDTMSVYSSTMGEPAPVLLSSTTNRPFFP